MRVFIGLAAAALMVWPAAGQHRGIQGLGIRGGGGGRVTAGPPVQRGMYGGISTGQQVGVIADPGFASRLGATVSGLPQTDFRIPVQGQYRGNPLGPQYPVYGRGPVSPGVYGYGGQGYGGYGRGRTNTVVIPFGVPVVAGPYGGYDAYDYTMAPPVQTVVQPVQPAPSVVINQYYTPETAQPEMKEYDDLPKPIAPPKTEVREPGGGKVTVVPAPKPARPAERGPSEAAVQAANTPTITLLGFGDSSVVAAIAYWQQGEELHYVASNYDKRVVPLSTLDKPLTEQLNNERRVEFRLEEIR